MNSARAKRGFTLVEAVVALALLTGGIIFMSRAVGSLARAEAKMTDAEKVNRLAKQKLDEIVAVGDFTTTSGEFDAPDDKFRWELVSADTGVTGLTGYELKVTDSTGASFSDGWARTLVYAANTTTTGGGQ